MNLFRKFGNNFKTMDYTLKKKYLHLMLHFYY